MRSRLVDVFMWVSAVSVASNIYLLIPIYSKVAEGIRITYDEVVLSSTIFTILYAVGLLSFGPISDFFSKRRILFIGMISSSIITVALSFSYSMVDFYLFRGLQGFVLGSFAPIAYAYCFEVFNEKRRTFLIAIINTGFLMSGIIGQQFSSLIVSVYHWKGIFYILSGMYLFISLGALKILPPSPRPISRFSIKSSRFSITNLLNTTVTLGLLITFFTLMSFVAFYDSLAQQFKGQEEALFYSRCVSLIGTPLSLLSGLWLKKYKPPLLLICCMLFMITAFISMLQVNDLVTITIFSSIYVSALSVFIPSLITYIGEAAAKNRATAISLYSFILLTGASLGPLIANVLSFHETLYLFSSLFVIFTMLLIFKDKYGKRQGYK